MRWLLSCSTNPPPTRVWNIKVNIDCHFQVVIQFFDLNHTRSTLIKYQLYVRHSPKGLSPSLLWGVTAIWWMKEQSQKWNSFWLCDPPVSYVLLHQRENRGCTASQWQSQTSNPCHRAYDFHPTLSFCQPGNAIQSPLHSRVQWRGKGTQLGFRWHDQSSSKIPSFPLTYTCPPPWLCHCENSPNRIYKIKQQICALIQLLEKKTYKQPTLCWDVF